MSKKNKSRVNVTRMLAEAGITIALSVALSFLKFKPVANGGSVDLVMVPLCVFALKWGAGWGCLAGLVFGTIKLFLGGSAFNLVSFVFDYSVAYAAVGLAGWFGKKEGTRVFGAFFGGFVRFIIHFISGFTVYAEWMPEEFLGMHMGNAFVYSALYNATYMIPNIIICCLVIAFLNKPFKRLYESKGSSM